MNFDLYSSAVQSKTEAWLIHFDLYSSAVQCKAEAWLINFELYSSAVHSKTGPLLIKLVTFVAFYSLHNVIALLCTLS